LDSSTLLSFGDSSRIAFIQSTWHRDIVDRARVSFIEEIANLGVAAQLVDLFEVPGAFEIPLHAKLLAQCGTYAGIVACGFVVDGGIYRHEFVADAVISGLMRVQLDTEVPVFSVVLTPHHFHEHEQHRNFFVDHFVTKGREAAHACASTLASLHDIRRKKTPVPATPPPNNATISLA
jgi:6,7-dimethyl-8-ribityllumazine synthase